MSWSFLGHKKKKPRTVLSIRGFGKKSRQRPTLPHGFPCSTIGSEELNFRVRDGIGCGLFEITTGNLWVSSVLMLFLVVYVQRPCLADPRLATRILGASSDVCLRDMVKPHDLLVVVSSISYEMSTPTLSTL